MSIFTTIGIAMQLLQEVMAVEPEIEKDIKDLLKVMDQIRQKYQQAQSGQ